MREWIHRGCSSFRYIKSSLIDTNFTTESNLLVWNPSVHGVLTDEQLRNTVLKNDEKSIIIRDRRNSLMWS